MDGQEPCRDCAARYAQARDDELVGLMRQFLLLLTLGLMLYAWHAGWFDKLTVA